jgi:DNA modification methylase
MSINRLILGDNLDIMKAMESETIDLIYLDPPFFSNRNYEVIWGDDGEVRSFQDRWAGGIEHYIAWLKDRVIEMHRILKPIGSIFLHCDWHADAYIRVEILDRIFGINNLRNEIVWCYMGPGSPGVKQFLKKHDTIFWYSKGDKWIFNLDDVRFPHSDKTRDNFKSGLEGSGFEGAPREINEKGKVPEDWWTDIAIAARFPKNSDNNIGYPTQKPVKLLERIIKAASNEGDIILDPFVGGGTTVAVAEKLNRKWIGIDQSVAAIKVSDLRLKNQHDLYSQPYELELRHYDYNFLRHQDAFEFEKWIIEQFGGIANPKQRNDFGLDGRMSDNTPIQVKRSDNIGRNVIDNFKSAVERSDKKLFEKNKAEGKTVGYIIAFSFGRGAIEEAARLKNKEHIIIELKKVSDIITYGKPPKVTLTANELEQYKYAFEASAKSEAGIEFYSWDFNHKSEDGFKADVYLDKEGKQVRKFKPGEHQIAVEAVDKSGLDGMDKIKLNVNGSGE